ncbi:plasmid mobilization relaxosome protein MobC [Paracidovorax wautersii]|uniref:plasmid mobilization protein n=1 Tax=Paracidovorax wautersii TaxID=1177982 RepID=UPI0031CFD3AB
MAPHTQDTQPQQKKKAPGRTNDDHRYRRTLRFEMRLSPVEYEALAQAWAASGCNSLARHVRARVFGQVDPVAVFQQQRRDDQQGRMQVLAALCRIGSNVNQIARQLNRYDPKSAEVLGEQLQAVKIELAQIAFQHQETPKGQP